MASANPLFKKPAIAAVATAGLVFIANLIGIWAAARFPHAGIWPANAILLGILATQPKSNNVITWVLSIAAYMVATLLFVGGFGQAALLTALNLITVVVGLLLIRAFTSRLSPVTKPADVVTLFAVMIAAAATAGVIGGLVTDQSIDGDWMARVLLRSATEFLNLAVFLPLVIGGLIQGPPPQKLTRDRGILFRHGVALAVLVGSCLLMVALPGPGSYVLYLPALIWCATRVRARVAFGLSACAALWTVTAVAAQVVLLGPDHSHISSNWGMASFRMGVGAVSMAVIAVVALNAFWRRTHYEQLARANYDSLTGLLNRTQFYESAKFSLEQESDGTSNIAIAIEIDRFNALNETRGQPASDRVLQTVAELLTANIRRGDIVGRLGGEEFAILLPGAGIDEGNRVAERMRESIAAESFSHDAGDFTTSVSIGLVEFPAPSDFSRMLSLADEALYEAKAAGRNRVVTYRRGSAAGAPA